jgi:hypothetical protein
VAGAGAVPLTPARDSLLCMHCRNHASLGNRCCTDSKLSNSSLQRCYGCGAVLQTRDGESPGYVPPDKYSIKQRHRQLGTLICRSAFYRPCLNRSWGLSCSRTYIPSDCLSALRQRMQYWHHLKQNSRTPEAKDMYAGDARS